MTEPPRLRLTSCRGGADKWFRDPDGGKLFWRGVTYGPFRPGADGLPWPAETQMRTDFSHMASLGFNVVRIYEPPSDAVLDAAQASGLFLLCGIPWVQDGDFIGDRILRRDTCERVRTQSRRLAGHPVVCGLLVGNEIDKQHVHHAGAARVQRFLESLIDISHEEAATLPAAYATYPSTEYLIPRNADFIGFNVFLESAASFEKYLRRLQIIADGKPLVITEFGLDTRQHGPAAQAEALRWQQQIVRDSAIAGNIWFSYTDEWHRGGAEITGWDFGLVTRDRKPKAACELLPQSWTAPARFDTPPAVSVIVCTRDGSATLRECLVALSHQTHAGCEIIVVDDGSTDRTPEIVRQFESIRYVRQDRRGLGAARNLGAKNARHEIVAYTDDDCVPDEDWLLHLVSAFEDSSCVGAGGPNLPPPPRTRSEAIVALAPGAPAEVLLDDVEAEHLPGCNLAIRKSALEAIGGFHEIFTTAGDDVDVCWRLLSGGGRLLFRPSAVVWHHRRKTIGAYLRQQRGYGRAETLLMKLHPERFSWFGGARWRGAIYGSAKSGDVRDLDIKDMNGTAMFPKINARQSSAWSRWFVGLLVLLLSILMIASGFVVGHAWWPGSIPLVISLMVTFISARRQAKKGSLRNPGEFLLLWTLTWLQPIVRDAARTWAMITLRTPPSPTPSTSNSPPMKLRRTILPLLVSLMISGCSKPREIDYKNLKKIEGALCEKGTTTPFTGIARDYFPDGKVHMEIPVKNGKFHGRVTEWHPNGKMNAQSEFNNGQLHGQNREWTDDGKPFRERVYDHDRIVSEKNFEGTK